MGIWMLEHNSTKKHIELIQMKLLWLGLLFFLVWFFAWINRREHFGQGICKGWLGLPDTVCWAMDPCTWIPKMGMTQWIRDWFCGNGGCPEGKVKEGGLCYDACKPGFKSDGAMLCWKQYPGFDDRDGFPYNTITSITKAMKTVMGSPLNYCGQKEMDAGLCYDKCKKGTKGIGPVCWQDVYGVGIGTIP